MAEYLQRGIYVTVTSGENSECVGVVDSGVFDAAIDDSEIMQPAFHVALYDGRRVTVGCHQVEPKLMRRRL